MYRVVKSAHHLTLWQVLIRGRCSVPTWSSCLLVDQTRNWPMPSNYKVWYCTWYWSLLHYYWFFCIKGCVLLCGLFFFYRCALRYEVTLCTCFSMLFLMPLFISPNFFFIDYKYLLIFILCFLLPTFECICLFIPIVTFLFLKRMSFCNPWLCRPLRILSSSMLKPCNFLIHFHNIW
jgi:hypothetical protein